jgi:hypothetical protein
LRSSRVVQPFLCSSTFRIRFRSGVNSAIRYDQERGAILDMRILRVLANTRRIPHIGAIEPKALGHAQHVVQRKFRSINGL